MTATPQTRHSERRFNMDLEASEDAQLRQRATEFAARLEARELLNLDEIQTAEYDDGTVFRVRTRDGVREFALYNMSIIQELKLDARLPTASELAGLVEGEEFQILPLRAKCEYSREVSRYSEQATRMGHGFAVAFTHMNTTPEQSVVQENKSDLCREYAWWKRSCLGEIKLAAETGQNSAWIKKKSTVRLDDLTSWLRLLPPDLTGPDMREALPALSAAFALHNGHQSTAPEEVYDLPQCIAERVKKIRGTNDKTKVPPPFGITELVELYQHQGYRARRGVVHDLTPCDPRQLDAVDLPMAEHNDITAPRKAQQAFNLARNMTSPGPGSTARAEFFAMESWRVKLPHMVEVLRNLTKMEDANEESKRKSWLYAEKLEAYATAVDAGVWWPQQEFDVRDADVAALRSMQCKDMDKPGRPFMSYARKQASENKGHSADNPKPRDDKDTREKRTERRDKMKDKPKTTSQRKRQAAVERDREHRRKAGEYVSESESDEESEMSLSEEDTGTRKGKDTKGKGKEKMAGPQPRDPGANSATASSSEKPSGAPGKQKAPAKPPTMQKKVPAPKKKAPKVLVERNGEDDDDGSDSDGETELVRLDERFDLNAAYAPAQAAVLLRTTDTGRKVNQRLHNTQRREFTGEEKKTLRDVALKQPNNLVTHRGVRIKLGKIVDAVVNPPYEKTRKGWPTKTWLKEKFPEVFTKRGYFEVATCLARVKAEDVGMPADIWSNYINPITGENKFDNPELWKDGNVPKKRMSGKSLQGHDTSTGRFEARPPANATSYDVMQSGYEPTQSEVFNRLAIASQPGLVTAQSIGHQRMGTNIKKIATQAAVNTANLERANRVEVNAARAAQRAHAREEEARMEVDYLMQKNLELRERAEKLSDLTYLLLGAVKGVVVESRKRDLPRGTLRMPKGLAQMAEELDLEGREFIEENDLDLYDDCTPAQFDFEDEDEDGDGDEEVEEDEDADELLTEPIMRDGEPYLYSRAAEGLRRFTKSEEELHHEYSRRGMDTHRYVTALHVRRRDNLDVFGDSLPPPPAEPEAEMAETVPDAPINQPSNSGMEELVMGKGTELTGDKSGLQMNELTELPESRAYLRQLRERGQLPNPPGRRNSFGGMDYEMEVQPSYHPRSEGLALARKTNFDGEVEMTDNYSVRDSTETVDDSQKVVTVGNGDLRRRAMHRAGQQATGGSTTLRQMTAPPLILALEGNGETMPTAVPPTTQPQGRMGGPFEEDEGSGSGGEE